MSKKPVFKTVYVRAPMGEAYDIVTREAEIGTEKITKMEGLLNPRKVEVEIPQYGEVTEMIPNGKISDVDVDMDEFASEYETVCNTLYDDGYDIVSVQPVLRGVHQHEYNSGNLKKGSGDSGFGYGFGYSLTAAFMILAKLREDK